MESRKATQGSTGVDAIRGKLVVTLIDMDLITLPKEVAAPAPRDAQYKLAGARGASSTGIGHTRDTGDSRQSAGGNAHKVQCEGCDAWRVTPNRSWEMMLVLRGCQVVLRNAWALA
ncbi:unnamed protein product, partial [Ilex paraguariensis]